MIRLYKRRRKTTPRPWRREHDEDPHLYHPERCEIEAEGHSGYAPMGSDIVCASVSTLLCTLAMQKGVQFEQRLGYMKVKAEASIEHLALFRAFADGLRMVAAQFPANVSIISDTWGDGKEKNMCYNEYDHGCIPAEVPITGRKEPTYDTHL